MKRNKKSPASRLDVPYCLNLHDFDILKKGRYAMKKILCIVFSALMLSGTLFAKDSSIKETVSDAAEAVADTAKEIAEDVSKEAKKIGKSVKKDAKKIKKDVSKSAKKTKKNIDKKLK